ncbi:golgin candidate 5-like [Neltuma alba]|uniref:golgin candidate 5-like n=1 Tax=Neltuma alba TaxID=207710 RepID=UPI0010A5A0D1|nr:golgin candidate 5-like [Prosopis alba]
MAWFSGSNSWGNFPDLAGAVNKLQESVKNIEKNFDSALGFEGKSESSNEGNYIVQEKTSGQSESSQQKPVSQDMMKNTEPSNHPTITEVEGVGNDNAARTETEEIASGEEKKVITVEEGDKLIESESGTMVQKSDHEKEENQFPAMPADSSEPIMQNVERSVSVDGPQENEIDEVENTASPVPAQLKPVNLGKDQVEGSLSEQSELHGVTDVQDNFQAKTEEERKEERVQEEAIMEQVSPAQSEESGNSKGGDETKPPVLHSVATEETDSINLSHDEHLTNASPQNESFNVLPNLGLHENEEILRAVEGDHLVNDVKTDKKEQHPNSVMDNSDSDSLLELEKVKSEMKMMETALQGAARQAQAKADEIARLMGENEHMKAMIEDLKRKSSEAEVETLREEYHQKVATLERKLYALTKERDRRFDESRVKEVMQLLY